jgi:hypothetical protein
MDRRYFLKTGGLAAAGLVLNSRTPALANEANPASVSNQLYGTEKLPPSAMIGIQIGAVSFVDEGTDKLLDGIQEMGEINTLFLASFSHGRGIGGRQRRPHPLPDHGKQEYDDDYHGGNFATPHPEYYKNTRINPKKRQTIRAMIYWRTSSPKLRSAT